MKCFYVLNTVSVIKCESPKYIMSNEHFQNYSSYEYVSRKRRGKKKGKPRSNQPPALKISSEDKNESDASNAIESTGDSNLGDFTEDNASDIELDQETDGEPGTEVKIVNNSDRVSLDGIMKAPPQFIYAEKMNDVFETKVVTSPGVNEADKLAYEEVKSIDVPEEEYQPINDRALSKHATTYELEKFEKKTLIIFNQEKIDGHKPRLGTKQDVEALTRTFESFDFEVIEHKDLTKDEVFKELKTFSESNFTDYGCVALAVLTHGSNNGLLRAKDHQYSEIEIINHFKVYDKPTLVTKPKIIIIQACRGTKIMQGAPVFQSGKIRKDHDEELEPYILPAESDMLILHSSYVGSPSHRDELYGSWFIQTLCRKIDQLAPTEDLESIITAVKREVAIDKFHEEYNKKNLEWNINKQMPVMTSTLLRKLYLKRFGDKAVTCVEKSLAMPSESSRNEVLDSAAPNTPLLVQFGPCSCFLDHFTYMRNCLRYYIEENPHDETAQNFLDIANTFEEGSEFNTAKEKMSKAICKHLINNARSCHYYKYLYFYRH